MNSSDDVLAVLKKAKEEDDVLGALVQLRPAAEAERKSFISQIVSFHNSGEINLFAEFQKLRNDRQNPPFFLTRHIFQEALPNLQGSPLEAARCTVHLVTQAEQDLMAEAPINDFRLFLDASPTRPAEVLAQIEQDPVALSRLLPTTIAAGFARDRASFTKEVVRLSQAPSIDLRRSAVFSMGNIELREHEEVPADIVSALESVASAVDDGVSAGAVAAATALFREHRTAAPQLEKVIRDALAKGDEWTLDAASRAFFLRSEKLGQPLVGLLAGCLREVPLANVGTIEQIDLGISVLLNSASRDVVLSLLEAILRRSQLDKQLKKFASARSTILTSPTLLSKVVTRWIATGEKALCMAAADLVQEASHRNPNYRGGRRRTPLEGRRKLRVHRTQSGGLPLFLACDGCVVCCIHDAFWCDQFLEATTPRPAAPELSGFCAGILEKPIEVRARGGGRRNRPMLASDRGLFHQHLLQR